MDQTPSHKRNDPPSGGRGVTAAQQVFTLHGESSNLSDLIRDDRP